MATINGLSTLANTDIAVGDFVPIYDTSAGTDKKAALFAAGSWTPALKFGGNSVGMTYSTQTGKYVQIATGLIWVGMQITLSAKGSSTGAATITGLPVGVAGVSTTLNIMWNTLGASVTTLQALASGTTITLYSTTGSTGLAGVTDATFAATSTIWISGCYAVS